MTKTYEGNVIDVLQELIYEHFPGCTTDDSFVTLYYKGKLDKFPLNFELPGNRNILKDIQEIAWNSRLRISLNSGIFSLKELA